MQLFILTTTIPHTLLNSNKTTLEPFFRNKIHHNDVTCGKNMVFLMLAGWMEAWKQARFHRRPPTHREGAARLGEAAEVEVGGGGRGRHCSHSWLQENGPKEENPNFFLPSGALSGLILNPPLVLSVKAGGKNGRFVLAEGGNEEPEQRTKAGRRAEVRGGQWGKVFLQLTGVFSPDGGQAEQAGGSTFHQHVDRENVDKHCFFLGTFSL